MTLVDTPAAAVARLDASLERRGQNVVLQRVVGSGPTATTADITVRAFVRPLREDELIAGLTQNDRKVVMSPTEITAAGWPGGAFSLPRAGDKVSIDAKPCNVEFAAPLRVAGAVVRIELKVKG